MTLPIPLTVRLKTAKADRFITRDLRSLSFRSTVPGGFASAAFSLDRPLLVQPDEIAYYGNIYIYDGRSGITIWEGRLEDLGRGASADGQVWELAAVGPSAHARDRTVPLIYVDSDLENWDRSGNSDGHGDVASDDAHGTPKFLLKWTEGTTVSNSDAVILEYQAIVETGQKLGLVRCNEDNGATVASFENRLATAVGTGSSTVRDSDTFSTTEGTLEAWVSGTNAIPNGDDRPTLRIFRASGGPAAVGTNAWGKFYNIVVRCLLLDQDGTERTSSGSNSNSTITTNSAVRDLLGRLLPKYDGANAVVASSAYNIEHLTYLDGTTAADVLDDLMTLDAAYYWAAWESNAAGLYRFEWKQWPTTVRYECDVEDGFDSPGSADGLFNAVTVRWKSRSGKIKRTRRTQTVQELTDAGLTREARIDLGDDIGSSGNATQAGDQFLAEHKYPPNAGTLTLARPVMDLQQARPVMPWEILPGNLIRVRGVRPYLDSLNANVRDGVTIFKIASVNYDTASATAQLELDSYPLAVSRALADLKKRRFWRRR